MGQNTSRSRNGEYTNSSSARQQPLSNDGSLASNTTTSVSPVVSRQSRRPGVRRSLLNLVRPRFQESTQNQGQSAGTKRKSWRRSRRHPTPCPELAEGESSNSSMTQEVLPTVVTEKISEHEDNPSSELPSPTADSSDAPSSVAIDSAVESSPEPTDTLNPSAQPSGESSQEITASLAHRLGLSRRPSEVEERPPNDVTANDIIAPPASDPSDSSAIERDAEPVTNQASRQSPSGEVAAAQQSSNRQFPPPGTLVVVQGVVHTTDVPHPNQPEANSTTDTASPTNSPSELEPRQPSSSSRPSTPMTSTSASSRNRLSALLRRPPSLLGSRPPSSSGDNRRNSSMPAAAPSSSQEPSYAESTEAESASNNTMPAPAIASTSENTVNSVTPNTDRPVGSISSSSIEVLGTLLSVAAAATAASLLTGSSEPIVTSGLAPSNSSSTSTQLPNSPSRPTSPTPTAGLGYNTMNNDFATTRAERVRQAWTGLRERLGLRGNATSSDNGPRVDMSESTPIPGLNRTRPDGTPMDPREVMLAEMARAFNMGLGLTNESNVALSSPPVSSLSGTEPTPPPRLPPEGSFDRFLFDLQVDLRAALTQETLAGQGEHHEADTPLDALLSGLPTTTTAPAEHASPPPPEEAASIPTIIADDRVSSPSATPLPDDDDDNVPPLGEVSDSSDSEFDGDEDSGDEEADGDEMPALEAIDTSASAQASFTPRLPSSSSARQQTGAWPSGLNADITATGLPNAQSDPGRNVPGRINWWRLYRFPPITATRAQGLAGILDRNASPTPSSPTTVSSAIQMSSVPATSESLSSSSSSSSAEPSSPASISPSDAQPSVTAEVRPNTVVPVIVVGLQSVNMNWRHEAGQSPPADNEDMIGAHPPASTQEPITADDVVIEGSDADVSQAEQGPGRGRSWGSRAANAIRNFRPGRRAASQPRQAMDMAGSRTFLIYVIGGYYPPDHSIVTGGSNNLESFEALLELAELLGPARPPTVSKEEIDKSGLEIINSARVQQYAKENKVSSNCTDKCLICLDDYDTEDEIRLMSCKHAFHKNCVDRWLQTGRNNCPACRSRGISTDGSNQPPLPTTGV